MRVPRCLNPSLALRPTSNEPRMTVAQGHSESQWAHNERKARTVGKHPEDCLKDCHVGQGKILLTRSMMCRHAQCF